MVYRKYQVVKTAINDLLTAVADEVYYTALNKGKEESDIYTFALGNPIEVDDVEVEGEKYTFDEYRCYEGDEGAYLYDNTLDEEVNVMDLNALQIMEVARQIMKY